MKRFFYIIYSVALLLNISLSGGIFATESSPALPKHCLELLAHLDHQLPSWLPDGEMRSNLITAALKNTSRIYFKQIPRDLALFWDAELNTIGLRRADRSSPWQESDDISMLLLHGAGDMVKSNCSSYTDPLCILSTPFTRRQNGIINSVQNDPRYRGLHYGIASFDNPGVGYGPRVEDFPDLNSYLKWMDIMVERMKKTGAPVILVGRSATAPLAAIYAARHPGKVDGLVVIGPVHPFVGMQESKERLLQCANLPPNDPEYCVYNNVNVDWTEKILKEINREEFEAVFKTIPTLVMIGEKDSETIEATRDAYKNLISDHPLSKFQIIPNAYHNVLGILDQQAGVLAYQTLANFSADQRARVLKERISSAAKSYESAPSEGREGLKKTIGHSLALLEKTDEVDPALGLPELQSLATTHPEIKSIITNIETLQKRRAENLSALLSTFNLGEFERVIALLEEGLNDPFAVKVDSGETLFYALLKPKFKYDHHQKLYDENLNARLEIEKYEKDFEPTRDENGQIHPQSWGDKILTHQDKAFLSTYFKFKDVEARLSTAISQITERSEKQLLQNIVDRVTSARSKMYGAMGKTDFTTRQLVKAIALKPIFEREFPSGQDKEQHFKDAIDSLHRWSDFCNNSNPKLSDATKAAVLFSKYPTLVDIGNEWIKLQFELFQIIYDIDGWGDELFPFMLSIKRRLQTDYPISQLQSNKSETDFNGPIQQAKAREKLLGKMYPADRKK